MRVLMFGWEFPPHISGGLGTACYGLSSALVKENVEVLFVMPTLTGDEPDNGTTLLNASTIKCETTNFDNQSRHSANQSNQPILTVDTIKIPAALSAYNLAHIEEPAYEFQHWSHRTTEEKHIVKESSEVKEETTFNTHVFKGGYGQKLLEEVYRYANVASQLANENRFDVIHAHDWMTYPAGIETKKATCKRLVIHVHATEFDRAGDNGNELVYAIEREAMTEADCIIAVSEWTKNTLIKNYEVDPDKIQVIYNGIEEQEIKIEKDFHPVGTQVVTFLGRITYQKGPEYFVDAAAQVAKVFPEAHFIMAGSGDFLPQIIEKVAQLKLSSRFHFTGFLKKEEINKVLAYTRVYVMPSVSEPFGITPLEAVQAGVPVIISNQSGVAEVLPHVLKTDFWNTTDLSQAICSVLAYKSLATELKINAGNGLPSITWKKGAEKIKKIYHELTRTNP